MLGFATLLMVSAFLTSSSFFNFLVIWSTQSLFIGYTVMIFIKFIFYVCLVNYQLRFLHKILQLSFKKKSASSKKVKAVQSDLVMKKLLVVRKVYNKISENGVIVNKTIGFTMMLLLLETVMIITYVGYEICRNSLDNSSTIHMSRNFLLKSNFLLRN